MAGDHAEEATPDPIPNSVVKLLRADGSNSARDCESRSLPAFIFEDGSSKRAAVFVCGSCHLRKVLPTGSRYERTPLLSFGIRSEEGNVGRAGSSGLSSGATHRTITTARYSEFK